MDKDFEELIQELVDKDKVIRRDAARSLGELGDIRAIEQLTLALQDESWDVRKVAAEALEKLKWKPQTNKKQIDYLIAKQDWDRCAAIGEIAINPLMALMDPETSVCGSYDGIAFSRSRIAEAMSKHFASYSHIVEHLRQFRKHILIVEDHNLLSLALRGVAVPGKPESKPASRPLSPFAGHIKELWSFRHRPRVTRPLCGVAHQSVARPASPSQYPRQPCARGCRAAVYAIQQLSGKRPGFVVACVV